MRSLEPRQRLWRHAGKGGLVAVLVMGSYQTGQAFEPATIVAAAATAKEAASKAKDFLEFIGYLPTEPEPLAELPVKLEEIQQSLSRIEQSTRETLEIVKRMEDAAVREENERTLNELLDALLYVAEARISLGYLIESPNDVNLKRDTDVASRKAVQEFESRPHIFRAVGPQIDDIRFHHILAYSSFLTAAALRAAFIQVAHGPRGFTHQPYRSELRATAYKLRELNTRIYEALEVRVNVLGERSSGHPPTITCTHATVTLFDHILYDRVAVEEHGESRLVEFPGDTCDQRAIDFYLEEPINVLRGERATRYGHPEIGGAAERLVNYSDYGQATPPDYRFPDWILGFLFNSRGQTFGPEAEAIPGAPVVLKAWAAQYAWKMPVVNGVFAHDASGLCMTAPAGLPDLTLELCSGAADQLWTRESNGWIRNQAHNLCLSWYKAVPGGVEGVAAESLHLAACDPGRGDQAWSTTDPTAPDPGPR